MVDTGDQGGAAGALTRQRRVVLDVIEASREHLTAVEIHEAARARLPRLSFATVYNSLKFLKEAGLVREISFGSGGASRFDRVESQHDHALCTRCGRLVDFDVLKESAALLRAAARRTGFEPEALSLTLLGVCPDCRGRRE